MTRFVARTAAQLLSRGRSQGSLLILIYHRVFAEPDPLLEDVPDAATFSAHMDLVAGVLNVLPLSEAIARLSRQALPARAACITFDDGYANNLSVALPILQARKLPATVFVSTSFVEGGRMWNDTIIGAVRSATAILDLTFVGLGVHPTHDVASRRVAVASLIDQLKYLDPKIRSERVEAIAREAGLVPAEKLMMNEIQLRELASAGIEIGAHTVTHPILTRLGEKEAHAEILASKFRLQEIVGSPVTCFAYPNGRPGQDYDARHVEMVKSCGYSCAVSTAWGACRADSDRFQLPRIAPWDQTPARFAARMIGTYLAAAATIV